MNKNFLKITTILCSLTALPGIALGTTMVNPTTGKTWTAQPDPVTGIEAQTVIATPAHTTDTTGSTTPAPAPTTDTTGSTTPEDTNTAPLGSDPDTWWGPEKQAAYDKMKVDQAKPDGPKKGSYAHPRTPTWKEKTDLPQYKEPTRPEPRPKNPNK